MKKLLAILGLLVLFAGVLRAQDCPFKVKFTVTPATCYNNGKVAYALVDDAGEALTAIPPGLSDVRIYYKISEDDSAHYGAYYHSTGGWDTLTIDYGEYIIGVEAACPDGLGGYIKLDTNTKLTVPTTYEPLQVSIVNRMATTTGSAGTRHTLSCANTGRVQFDMRKGKFPYTIEVKDKTSGDPLKNIIYDTNMYNTVYQRINPRDINSGYDTSRIYADHLDYNYFFYYTVDSLPAGEWEFNFSDGCGYVSYPLYEKIEVVDIPILDHINVYSAPNDSDYNLVKISLEFEHNNDHYLRYLAENGEYRFVYDDFQNKGWRKFNLNGKDTTYVLYNRVFIDTISDQSTRNYYNRRNKKYQDYASLNRLIFDTIAEANSYCDIWGKNITFEYRVNDCGNQTFSKTFQLNRPNENAFYYRSSSSNSQPIYDTNQCPGYKYDYFSGHTIGYIRSGYHSSNNFGFTYWSENEDCDSSYNVTLPVIYTFVDTLNNNICIDTSYGESSHSFPTRYNYEQFFSLLGGNVRMPIKVTAVDAKGCEVFSTVKVMDFYKSSSRQNSYWDNSHSSKSIQSRCEERYVGLYLYLVGDSATRSKYDPDGTVVKLVKSPSDNFYNFEATYNSTLKDWSVVRSNPDNNVEISERLSQRNDSVNRGTRLYLTGDLKPGEYQFNVTSPCGERTVYSYVVLMDSTTLSAVTEEAPACQITRDCSYTYLTIPSFGKAIGAIHSNDRYTGNVKPIEYKDLTIKPEISVISGSNVLNRYPEPNEQVRLLPGRYRVYWRYEKDEDGYNFNVGGCNNNTLHRIDTIIVDTFRVSHNYAIALMCEPESTIGTVYVKGDKGMEPYKYVLFNDANMQGDTIGVNTEGKFTNIPMGQRSNFSCQITDDCGSSYHVNMIPSILSNMQKVWFDGGLDSTSTCEGSTVRVNAIELGDILSYKWTGPNGFSDSIAHPEVYIPRGAESGWYKVVIRNTGCAEAIVDSIYLTVMEKPTLSVSQGVSECFGAGALVKLSPNSPRSTDVINFTVAYEDNGVKETRSYSAAPKDTVSDNYPSFTAKVYGVSIDDGHCITTLVDDTLQLSTSIGDPIPVTITITCPADVEKAAEVGNCTALAVTSTTLDEATATHSLGWALEINAQLPADSMLAAGENTVMWIATDRCGNADTCTQKVTVTFPDCPSVTDADGNTYESVRIGCDCWMQRNLESSTYADNSPISWAKGYESFMHPDADANIAVFGRLYDFASAVKDSADNGHGHVQGACPDGWHLPTPAQYSALLGMDATTLKTSEYWIDGGGNNSTGFAWLPAGRYNGAATRFEGLLASSWFWSVDGTGENLKVYSFCTRYSCDTVMEDSPANGSAYSIRCVKEKE